MSLDQFFSFVGRLLLIVGFVLVPAVANAARPVDAKPEASDHVAAARKKLATKNLDDTFERVQAGDAEVVQEPTEQPYGVRDCAIRDPAGNLIRIQEQS